MTSPLNLLIYSALLVEDIEVTSETAVAFDDAGPSFSLFAKGISARYLKAEALSQAQRFLANPHRVFPFSNGRSVYLPGSLDIFASREENWRLLRLYSAIQAGQWELGTFDRPNAIDAQAIWGKSYTLDDSDHLSWVRFFIGRFPLPGLAGDIFITLETARVTAGMTRCFRGLEADLHWYLPRVAFLSDSLMLPRGLLWNLFLELFNCRGAIAASKLLHSMLEVAEKVVLPGALLKDTLRLTIAICAILEPLVRSLKGVDRLILEDWADYQFLGNLPGRDGRSADHIILSDLNGGFSAIDEELAKSLEDLTFIASRIPAGVGSFLTEELSAKRMDEGEEKRESAGGTWDAGEDEDDGRYPEGRRLFYPEWDYIAGTYHRDWVSVYPLDRLQLGDEEAKDLLEGWEDLIKEVSRQFRMLTFEDRSWRKRLLDGEEIELDQALQGKVELRGGITPSEKLYMEKRRKGREVSAFLLVDLSASTSFKIDEGDHEGETVLQLLLASVAIMSQALEQLGDRHCVYGRKRVELQRIKSFDENLSPGILTGMGQMRSQRSTRMGAAVRHAHHVLSAEPAELRLLLVLSDGFPQDCDYGDDRNDREYGLRDTVRALLEAEMDGILPFCISVDAAGHDYLRRMCLPRAYLVVNSVQDLPRELPKIYMRLRNQ
jgi:nitric oxide reductase NorD protein